MTIITSKSTKFGLGIIGTEKTQAFLNNMVVEYPFNILVSLFYYQIEINFGNYTVITNYNDMNFNDLERQ